MKGVAIDGWQSMQTTLNAKFLSSVTNRTSTMTATGETAEGYADILLLRTEHK